MSERHAPCRVAWPTPWMNRSMDLRGVLKGVAAGLIPWVLIGCAAESGSLAGGDAESEATYRRPVVLDDGWIPAEPEEFGLSREPLEAMTAAIRRNDYHNVHAVLVAKDGRLVYEEYFTGTDRRPESGDYAETVTLTFDRETLHTTRSAGKSFTSALIGVALADGAIPSIDQPLLDFFPEYEDVADPAVGEITVADLLTMTPGLSWDQAALPYSDPRNSETALYATPDPAAFLFALPVTSPPGSRWVYSSGTATLLGLILHDVTETSYATYIRERLFEPLEIDRFDWTGTAAWADHPAFAWEGAEPWAMTRASDPAGSLWLRPRDMLKFGQLFANGGTWNGTRVLRDEWVAASLAPHVPRSDASVEYPSGTTRQGSYGYQWWHDRLALPYGELVVHSASGAGGQKIWLVPEHGLAVVHLAGNYNLPGYGWETERLLFERIVPWAMGLSSDYRHQRNLEPVDVDPASWPLSALAPEDLPRYVGTYDIGGERVLVRAVEGRLQLLPPIGMGPIDLIPADRDSFVHGVVHRGQVTKLYAPDERLVFAMDEDGRATGFEVVGGSGVLETGVLVER